MKRLLIIIAVCLSMTVNLYTVFAEDEQTGTVEIEQSGYASDIELAINLGLTEGYDAVYDIYSEITRAEFVVLCANLRNNNDFSTMEQVFKDVDTSNSKYADIAQMYALGYIIGDGNGLFHPDDPIKTSDAARIILSIAGYNFSDINQSAADAMKRRGESDLLSGVVPQTGYLTNGNAIRMIVNALDLNIVEMSLSGDGTYFVNDEETIMSTYLEIAKIKGQLTATQYANIVGSSELAEGEIIFAGERMRSYDYDDYLGYYGTCYFRENEYDEGEYDVLYIKPDKNNAKTVRAEDIVSYTPYTFKYYKDDSTQARLTISRDTVFLYNDAITDNFSDEMLLIKNGYINFLDADDDNVYEIVKIYEYENMVVESISNDVIYSKFDASQNIDLDKYEKIYIYNESGKSITADAIGIDNVISIYKSKDSRYTDTRLKLVVSTQTVSGTISSLNTDDRGIKAVIDGEEYAVYSDYQSMPPKNMEIGDKGTYLLDANRQIVSIVSLINDKYKPAYLIKTRNISDDPSVFNISIKAVFSDSGSQTAMVSSKKVMVDGITYKDGEYQEAYDRLLSATPGVVMVKTNEEGLITAVDTLNSNVKVFVNGEKEYNMNDCLYRGTAVSGARYKSETMVFEGKCSIDDNTTVFIIPNDVENAEESEFTVTNSKYFGNDTAYDLTPYYLSTAEVSADIVVMQGSAAGVGYASKIGVVTKVVNGYNEEEEVPAQIYTVNVFGAEETWVTKDDSIPSEIYKITLGSATADDTIEVIDGGHTIRKGDIIKCSFDENNNVNRIVLIYDAQEDTMVSVNPSVEDFHSPGYRYAMGTVDRKSGKVVELVMSDGSVEYHAVGNKPIMILDAEEGETVQTAAFSDIRTGDKMLSINRGGNTVCSYIVR